MRLRPTRFTPVSHQLYVKSSVVNGCIATPTNLKLLLRALLHHIGAQGDERDAELAVAKVQCANESSTNSTDGLVALTAATAPRCAAASLHLASSRPVSAPRRTGATPRGHQPCATPFCDTRAPSRRVSCRALRGRMLASSKLKARFRPAAHRRCPRGRQRAPRRKYNTRAPSRRVSCRAPGLGKAHHKKSCRAFAGRP